jgi:hypothetical protein
MLPSRKHASWIAAGLLGATLIFSGCGGDSDEGTARQPPPDPSSFPSASGRTLEQVLSEADGEGPVISPTGQVFYRGENRYGFGVFTLEREQITDAEVAIYVAHGAHGEAKGPFPARVESLETDPAFESQTTAGDPDAARVVYVTEVEFDGDGEWRIVALVREGESLEGSRAPSAVVGELPSANKESLGVGGEFDVPQPGERAPRVHTPTEEDVANLSAIDTRQPHDTMHEDDLTDALGEEPVVLLFATPALCQSRVCGPVVDVAEQVKSEHGEAASFIHMEIYEDNVFDKGLRPQVKAYNLPTEPWLFVIDRGGTIRTAIEGAFGVDELERAVEQVTD